MRADKVGYDTWISVQLAVVDRTVYVRAGMAASRNPATVIARNQLQIAGALKTRQIGTGEFTELAPDYDYFRVSLAAGETLSVNMLSTQGFFLSIVDAHQALSKPQADVSSDVINVSYTNGAAAQDVYIQVTSGPYDFKTNNQYRLSLTYR